MSNKRNNQTRKKERNKSRSVARGKNKAAKITKASGSTKVQQQLAQAIGLHQQNKLSEAEALYRGILAEYPGNIDAMHALN